MIGWVRRVLLHRETPGPADARLDAAELEVERQTAQIRRIRREAQAAELRLRRANR